MKSLQSLELLLALKGILPFMLVTSANEFGSGNQAKEGVVNINVARIVEALIVAVITALATSYMSVKLLEQRLDFVDQQQQIYVQNDTKYKENLERRLDRLQEAIQQVAVNNKR